MKVAFIAPSSAKLRKMHTSAPPFNLGILANYARQNFDCEVRIFDGEIGQDYLTDVKAWSPDVACITATTPQAPLSYEASRFITKEFGVNCKIIMGGVHPTIMPAEAKYFANTVVIGEGERALIELLHKIRLGEPLPKFLEGKPIMNLDETPMPAWDLIDVEKYMDYVPQDERFMYGIPNVRLGYCITSRGCPWKCAFCWNSFRKVPPRWSSAEKVVEEIHMWIDRYRATAIFFVDDEMVVHKARLNKIADILKRDGVDVAFGGQAHATSVTKENASIMKSMGFKFASVGFESGNDRVLSMLKCGSTTVALNELALKNANAIGLPLGGSFIFGTPTETKEEMLDTVRFIEKHEELLAVGINVLIPYPTTKIWDIANSLNLLPKDIDYSRLVSTSKATDAYILCNTMKNREFKRFIMDLQRIVYLQSKTNYLVRSSTTETERLEKFISLYRHKFYWYMTARHPRRTYDIFTRKILKGKLRTGVGE